MSKIIALTVLTALVGTSVVAWSRSTGSEMRREPLSAFSPDEMRLKVNTGLLPVQKIDDKSFVFTEND